MNPNRYLLNYRADVTSQDGEDGIIAKIFEVIPNGNRWCVEFGAWDGKRFSNTYTLIQNGWHGVLIEGEASRCASIAQTHAGKAVTPVNSFITSSGPNSLDNILKKTDIPKDFDFLSIDIDGNDYHIWRGLTVYRPKAVVIEFNATVPANIEFVQADDPHVRHGNSILSMTLLARSKGYELICINHENAFFVDRQFFDLFQIADNSIESIKPYREPLQVFQLYDGTMCFHGSQWLYFLSQRVDMNRKLQVVPKWLRNADLPWNEKRSSSWFYRLALRVLARWNRVADRRDSGTEGPFEWKHREDAGDAQQKRPAAG